MGMLETNVYGTPAPKGSYNAVRNRAGRQVFLPASRREPVWRAQVAAAIRGAWIRTHAGQPLPHHNGPIGYEAIYYMPRPKTIRRLLPTVPPDLDKITRSTWDGITDSGLIADDSRITIIGLCAKVYADRRQPGAWIRVSWGDDMPGIGVGD